MTASPAVVPERAPEEAPPQLPRLQLRGLSLTLGWRMVLDDVSFDLRPGEVLGVLGPSGCGKTSILRCLTGLSRPDKGTLLFDGQAVELGDPGLRLCLGMVFQEPSLDLELTAEENLLFGARLFGVSRHEARERAHSLLSFMELGERARDPARLFSGGMRRRLELARALIHRPTLLLLDEPTRGLEQSARERTWRLVRTLNRTQGLTVLLATRDALEAELCDRVLVVDRGHLVACDAPAELLRRVAGDVITLTTDRPHALAESLRESTPFNAQCVEGAVVLEVPEAHTWVPRLVEAFPPGTIRSVSVRRPSLADVFLKLTGRSLDEAVLEPAS